MPAPIRMPVFFLGAILCLSSGLLTASAYAQTPDITPPPAMEAVPSPPEPPPAAQQAPATTHKTVHHKARHVSKKHKTGKAAKKGGGDTRVREAQMHLVNLGYYKGKVDGLSGPKTRAAIKKFQHEHKLRANGTLTKQTYDAIVAADKKHLAAVPPLAPPISLEPPPTPAPDFYATHPDYYGHVDQAYDNPLLLGPTQTLASRFAKVQLTEDSEQEITQSPAPKRYNITLNGLPLVLIDGQPTVISVSRTFALGDEDVMIFTTYKDKDPTCAYAYTLLILDSGGTSSREVHNCTRGYQAKVNGSSLFITFPESDDARAVGNTWRYEKGDLEKL